MSNKMCVNCKYLKDGKYCNRKKSDIFNPKIFCGYWRSKPTVFDRIAQSPEVLAEKLLYAPLGEFCKLWYSTVLPGEHWNVKEEAIAATVKKLKEVDRGS